VYQLAGLAPDPRRIMFAAQLWGGPAAVVSHRAAAVILGLDGIRDASPEIWSPTAGATTGIIVHTGTMARSDIATTGPVRHTNPVRTTLDLARVVDGQVLEMVVESVLRRNRRWERQLLRLAESGQRGCRAVQRVLALRGAGVPPTESELETRYIQLIRSTSVPPPIRQFRVVNELGRVLGRLDLCWPEAKLWVELDGSVWHDQPDALFRDRERQNDVVAELAWLPLRFTWRDVLGRPAETAAKTEATYWRRLAPRT
jgi:very-short-patch-repair endonuclease